MKELPVYVNHWIIYCACGGSLACYNVEFDLRRRFAKAWSIALNFEELTYQNIPKVSWFDCFEINLDFENSELSPLSKKGTT